MVTVGQGPDCSISSGPNDVVQIEKANDVGHATVACHAKIINVIRPGATPWNPQDLESMTSFSACKRPLKGNCNHGKHVIRVLLFKPVLRLVSE